MRKFVSTQLLTIRLAFAFVSLYVDRIRNGSILLLTNSMQVFFFLPWHFWNKPFPLLSLKLWLAMSYSHVI